MAADSTSGAGPDPAPIRWGICGTGRIAAKFVAGLRMVPDAVIGAVASRTAERAVEFARAHGIARSHVSWAALAADDEIDVVYVAVTQESHRLAVLQMLRGGRHVLCEKPLAMSEAQAVEMFDEAAVARRFLMEAMWSRFSPAYRRLGELLDEGGIGTVMQLSADLSLRVPPAEIGSHRLYDPERGGGALLDVGIYPLQLSSLLFGAPQTIGATGVLAASGVDEQVAVALGHSGGRVSALTASICVVGSRSARISGSTGSITIEAPMHAPSRLVLESGGGAEVLECDPPGLHLQVAEVHRCIRAGLMQSPVMPWQESSSLLATTDRVRSIIGLRYPGE